MIENLEALIFRCIERYWASKYNKRYGLVTSYDPQKHAAKVTYQPDQQESGWLPIHAHHIGNGWGILVGLQVGDQVEITHQEADFEVGAITSRVHSDAEAPPVVQSGEMLLQHQDGRKIFFDSAGNLTAAKKDGTTMQLGENGDATLTDKAGGIVYCDGTGKIRLGNKNANLGVMLAGGVVSQRIFGVIS